MGRDDARRLRGACTSHLHQRVVVDAIADRLQEVRVGAERKHVRVHVDVQEGQIRRGERIDLEFVVALQALRLVTRQAEHDLVGGLLNLDQLRRRGHAAIDDVLEVRLVRAPVIRIGLQLHL